MRKLLFCSLLASGQISAQVFGADAPATTTPNGVFARSENGGRRNIIAGENDRVIPQVVDGDTWQTSFILTNLDTKPLNIALLFKTDDGEDMTLPLIGFGPSSAIYGALAVNQSIEIATTGISSALSQGYAVLLTLDRPLSDPSAQVALGRVGGMAIFRQRSAGRADFEAVVPMSSTNDSFFVIPFDNRSGYVAGIALVNVLPTSSPISVIARDMDGRILLQDSFVLPAWKKIAFAVGGKYPQLAGKNGILQFSTPSIGLAGLGLRFSPNGPFTSIHSLSIDVDPNAPSAPSTIPPALPGLNAGCGAVEGALVFAQDGAFLGKITSNATAADSLGNSNGRYGNQYSAVSIFNPYGKYGSQYSALSPFNPFTSTPPWVVIGNNAVAYLTVNTAKIPRLDPVAIYPCIGKR